jgi:hypothetical protein
MAKDGHTDGSFPIGLFIIDKRFTQKVNEECIELSELLYHSVCRVQLSICVQARKRIKGCVKELQAQTED